MKRVTVRLLAALAAAWAASAGAQDRPLLLEVPTILAEPPADVLEINSTAAAQASIRKHRLTVDGQPFTGQEFSLWGGKTPCAWQMPTPQAGDYVVTVFLTSGRKRPGQFAYFSGQKECVSQEFRENGEWSGCQRAYRIVVPAGQTETRMYVIGHGIYLRRVEIFRATRPLEHAAAGVKELAASSYRTVLRRTSESGRALAALVLAPAAGPEAQLARELAAKWKLPVAPEQELTEPLPAYPAVRGAAKDTNLILLSAGVGGPLVRALRRAGWVLENRAIPGPGGWTVRTLARPFDGRANVIVISGGDAAGLAQGVRAFAPAADAATGELVYNKFLVDTPGERWRQLRLWQYRPDDEDWWQQQFDALKKPYAGIGGGTPSREFIRQTAEWGDWYWKTGLANYAELFKRYILKMEDEGIYGGPQGSDSHMELYGLIRAWDRVEESSVFTAADRLRIVNFLLRCVEGHEGFALAYGQCPEYVGAVRMRHNHQTILGCGLLQASLYFGRLYQLPKARTWKAWCDDIVANATFWGHAPEDAINDEPRTFMEVADMLHYQGLSSKGPEGTRAWPDFARRFLAARDSFSLPAAYGDCWSNYEWEKMEFMELLRDDWNWPAAQWAIDRLIRGFRYADPKATPGNALWTYLHGSTDVGGLLPPPDAAAAKDIQRSLTGLAALPMSEGYWRYQTGQIGNKLFWDEHGRPEVIPYQKTADKIQYRSGWTVDDEYLLLEALGWADHGHMDLGTLVQYCQGGRLWIVDGCYNNVGVEHHSTLEVKRDGQPAWHNFKGEEGERWGDFRPAPQMFEVVQLDPSAPGRAGPFRVVCRARNLAGATWERAVSGGGGRPLTVEDTLTADQAGAYDVTFRLRLLGRVTGAAGQWSAEQTGAALPIHLEVADGDTVGLGPWLPDDHAFGGGAYPWYPFAGDGIPKTLAWRRKIKLEKRVSAPSSGPSLARLENRKRKSTQPQAKEKATTDYTEHTDAERRWRLNIFHISDIRFIRGKNLLVDTIF